MIDVGIDFGGTKIEAAAMNLAGDVVTRHRRPTPDNYDDAIAEVGVLVGMMEREVGAFDRIGVGMPGSVSPHTGVLHNANTRYLNGRNFREDLEVALSKRVRLANDANCFALSEAVDGAGAGHAVVFGVILGTGCGGGLVVNGRLVQGANGVAGEWGHNPLPWPDPLEQDGPICWCGHQSCLETWVSGTGLQRDIEVHSGERRDGAQIAAAARAEDSTASAAIERHFSRLARGLATIVNVIDPDVFVFGGGLSNMAEIYRRVPDLLRPLVFGGAWKSQLVAAKWGDSSGVRGAARLWQGEAR